MKFIADINIAQKVITLLNQTGHDVVDIKKLDPRTPDTSIINLALIENRIILTHDKDFLGLTKFPKYRVGVIMIRLSIQNALHHYKKLKDVLQQNDEDVLRNSLTILYEESVEVYPYE